MAPGLFFLSNSDNIVSSTFIPSIVPTTHSPEWWAPSFCAVKLHILQQKKYNCEGIFIKEKSMNLVIHDLSSEEWNKIEDNYEGWNVISNSGKIKPCIGCFGCWVKTPGRCVIKDGYERTGSLYAQAEEVVIISRFTFGGFSSFVKNVIDKSINWSQPYFEIRNNEMHHIKRYNHSFDLTVHFYGDGITKEYEEQAEKYAKAVCTNYGVNLKCVDFNAIHGHTLAVEEKTQHIPSKKTLLLNCSLKGSNSNSRTFLEIVNSKLDSEAELVNLGEYLNRYSELTDLVKSAEKLVFAMPLFVDGMPSVAVRLMEELYIHDNGGSKKVYVISNQGFYESKQSSNLLSQVKNWAKQTGYKYCGGMAIGAGEMLGLLIRKGIPQRGPARNVFNGLYAMADAIAKGEKFEDMYVEPYKFPRFMYMSTGNKMWPQRAKAFGISKKDMLKPDTNDKTGE